MSDPRKAPSIFTRGAVDLGALRQTPSAGATASRPAAPAGEGAAPVTTASGDAVIIDVSEATFQRDVMDRSLRSPVILDFWAEWCQPCKQLSPVLEKLAVEANGAWVLAKVDVDANQRLAQALRVQSIPTVFAIVKGQPVDAFNGAVPESQLRQWIDAVCKTAGVEVAQPEDPRHAAAEDAMAIGDLDTAEQAYRRILAESPADAAAEAGLAQVGLLRRTEGVDPGTALAAAAAVAPDAADYLPAQLLAADVEMMLGEAEGAYRRLIDLVRRTAGDDRERVRKHLIGLFSVAGPDDPAVGAARRALASALF